MYVHCGLHMKLFCTIVNLKHTHIYSTVQVLSIGSPNKTTRSRSLSPAPGHRGFSFSRETLGRLDSPGAAYSPASPLNTMNLNNTGKFSVK